MRNSKLNPISKNPMKLFQARKRAKRALKTAVAALQGEWDASQTIHVSTRPYRHIVKRDRTLQAAVGALLASGRYLCALLADTGPLCCNPTVGICPDNAAVWSQPVAASDRDDMLRPLLPVQLGVALLHQLIETATVSVPVLDGCGLPIPGQMQVRMRCGGEVCRCYELHRPLPYLLLAWHAMPSATPCTSHGGSTTHNSPAGLMSTGSGNCSAHLLPIQADRARMHVWVMTQHTGQ